MRQNADFIHSTCFGHQYAHHQEYNSEFRFGIQTWRAVYKHLTAQWFTTQTASRFGYESGTHYFTPDDGHIGARNMLRQ